ncbi:hypothetical protein DZ956_022290 [Pseudomonas aeruginosa]|nr:hypothetical protein [Pseudomonas aeruginosa]
MQAVPKPDPASQWAAVRTLRDQLLQKTDRTQLPDFPITEEQRGEVAAYRQALRDVPEKGDDPLAVVWPVKPAFLK